MKKPRKDELLAEVRVIANEVQHLKAAQSEIMREVRHIKGSVSWLHLVRLVCMTVVAIVSLKFGKIPDFWR